MKVFAQLLKLHAESQKFTLLVLSVGAFALPLGLLKALGSPIYASNLSRIDEAIFLIPAAAVMVGGAIGVGAWEWDLESDHVYAMSLPATRWEYALLKMAAGAILILLPTLMFWGGSMLGTGSVELGDSVLQTYAAEVASRFLFVALLVFAFSFAITSGTKQAAGIIFGGGFLLLFLGEGAMTLMGMFVPGWPWDSFMEPIFFTLIEWPGPLSVLTGNWMLIDF